MSLQDLVSGDPREIAEVLHTIAGEVESSCMILVEVRRERGPMDSGIRVGGDRLILTFVATGKHDDDLLVGLE